MIPQNHLKIWRKQAPWKDLVKVEQDLIISKALVSIYKDNFLKERLIFRGGTALNKLFLSHPARYSEDIDLTQVSSEPIGEIVDRIRIALSWIGTPKTKTSERSFKMLYPFTTIDGDRGKLKIEINTTEHFHLRHLQLIKHEVDTPWFSGSAEIHTYNFNEIMASKLKALYGRRKGRDLFDIWYVLEENTINKKVVIQLFQEYFLKCQEPEVTRAIFEKNLWDKFNHPEFSHDMHALLSINQEWDFQKAFFKVHESLITLLPGDEWKDWGKSISN